MWTRPFLATLLVVTATVGTGRGQDEKAATPLTITVVVPKKPPTLGEVNDGTFKAHVKLENTSKESLVLWPFLSAKLLDSRGKPVRPSLYLGRWGLRQSDSVLEDIPFITLKPGQTHNLEVGIASYILDPMAITGWQLPSKGEYKLELRYEYDRAKAKKAFGDGCRDIDNPKRPWNHALPISRKIEIKLQVAEDPPDCTELGARWER
jgi:hypothetical protein